MKVSLFKPVLLITFASISSVSQNQEIAKADYDAVKMDSKEVRADDVITTKDQEKIKRSALYMLREFENDLNILSKSPGMDSAEVSEMIRNRCTDSKRKIFYDSTAIIEDNIWHTAQNTGMKIQEKRVRRYLGDFDIFYRKNDSATVTFSNLQVSNVKKSNYLYIQVFYDCLFTGKSRLTDNPYVLNRRIAEFKVEKAENKWHTWIINIRFLNPDETINKSKNDITVVQAPESKAGAENDGIAAVLSFRPPVAVSNPAEKEKLLRENEMRREELAYKSLLEKADEAYNKNDHSSAYQKYQYALKLKPNEEYPKMMSAFTKKKFEHSNMSQEEQYNLLVQKAKAAENKRKYEEAKEYYVQALNIKQEETLNAKVRELTEILITLVQANTKYSLGDYQGTLKTLMDKPGEKNPEYFLLTGKCYEKLSDWEQAIKAYTAAINLDPDMIDAYKRRARIEEQNKNYTEALVDYTVLAAIGKSDVDIYVKIADLNRASGNLQGAKEALDKALMADNNRSYLFHKKGAILYEEGNLLSALENFKLAIQKDPASASGYFYKGLCEAGLKKFREASEDFAKARVLGIDPSYQEKMQAIPEACYQKAVVYYNNHKTDSAITWLDHALTIDPNKDEYFFTKGECFRRLKNYDEAINNYTKAIQLNPKNYEAYKQRGIIKFNLSNYRESIADMESACGSKSKDPMVYKLMGDYYYMSDKYSTAIKKYDTALMVTAKARLKEDVLADLLNKRGKCRFRLTQYPDALEDFENAILYNNKEAEFYFNRGETFIYLNKPAEAKKDIIKALSYQPGNAFWNYILGQVFQFSGQMEKAVSSYSKAIALDTPNSIGIMPVYSRAKCYVTMKLFPEALKDYLFIKQKNSDMYAHFEAELGSLFLELNQPEKAITYFQETLQKDSTDVDAIYGMGVALVLKNQIDKALPWFEKAFSTGKVKPGKIKADRKMEDIRDHDAFKVLMQKYF